MKIVSMKSLSNELLASYASGTYRAKEAEREIARRSKHREKNQARKAKRAK